MPNVIFELVEKSQMPVNSARPAHIEKIRKKI